MLPNVANGSARRCAAICRARGDRCRKLAVLGCKTCPSHGGHKKVKRGQDHWNYQGAAQTLLERAQRHEMSVFFYEAETLMFALDMVVPGSQRTRGRKPVAREA